MARTYMDTAFKLHLPKCEVFDDHVKINYKFEYKTGNTEKIMYYKMEFIDRVNNVNVDETSHIFAEEGQKLYPESIRMWSDKRKIFIVGSTLKFYFLSNSGERTEVTFYIKSMNEIVQLVDVSKQPMSEHEKRVYIDCFQTEHMKNEDAAKRQRQPNVIEESKNNLTGNNIPGLRKYRDALKQEKYYLMNQGGRKYKVTNGKLISKEKGIYSYVFDLETELHISDDAPITVSVSENLSSVKGSVLLCEDFQIIVQLEQHIGENIGSAYVNVEPWKLLEALEERLYYGIDINGNQLTSTLFDKGPLLAGNIPIEQIPKGQDAVIKKAMEEPICVVWGPPGTGKTHTMSELAIRFMKEDKSVLIVSHSNVSVDGVAKKIYELLEERKDNEKLYSGKILRYGYVRDEQLSKNQYVSSFYYAVCKNQELSKKIDSLQEEYNQIKKTKGFNNSKIIELREEISKIRAQVRTQEQRYVSNAQIVATTISKVVIDSIFEEKRYDVVMFDEVSMAYVLQVVCAATFAKEHLICVGDFMQLAPIAQSDAKTILCQDIFTFLGINQRGKPYFHPWLVMLDEQRRMEPKISEFPNKYVYRGLLKNHESTYTNRENIVASPLFKNNSVNLIDLFGTYCAASKNADNSRFNILSALISFAGAVKTEESVNSVSIITPYAAQTRLIRALTLDYRETRETNIRCSTVHQFQGSESNVIFFDAVESYPSLKPGWLMGKDFNSILRLINVAVTRAKGKLVTVANERFWSDNYKNNTKHTFYQLLNYIKTKGNVVNHSNRKLEELLENISVKGGPQFFLKPENYIAQFRHDMEKAKERIIISLPCGFLKEEYEDEIFQCVLAAKNNGLQVLIKSNDYKNLPEKWKKYTVGTANATFPIVMIDDKIVWYGVPLAPWKFETQSSTSYVTVSSVVCRIKGEKTAEMIKSLTDLEYKESASGKFKLQDKSNKDIFKSDSDVGLAGYIKEHMKCPVCKKPLVMSKGKSGKTILWCKECKKTELLRPEDINHYMVINHVRCPKHNCGMTAKVGKYGIYIKCDMGHYVKPEEI